MILQYNSIQYTYYIYRTFISYKMCTTRSENIIPFYKYLHCRNHFIIVPLDRLCAVVFHSQWIAFVLCNRTGGGICNRQSTISSKFVRQTDVIGPGDSSPSFWSSSAVPWLAPSRGPSHCPFGRHMRSSSSRISTNINEALSPVKHACKSGGLYSLP